MKRKSLMALLGLLVSMTAKADPSLIAGFACFDRDSYIEVMADMQQHHAAAAQKLFPDKCVTAETVNTFRFDITGRYSFADTIGVKFPNSKPLKMYTNPAWVKE